MLRLNNLQHINKRKKTVNILGGGLGGLTAACRFSAHSHFNCNILEQNSLPGGRLQGIWINGNYFDIGATLIVSRLIHLLKMLGIHIPTFNLELDLILTENRIPIRFPIRKQTWKDIQFLLGSQRHKILSNIVRIFKHPNPDRDDSVITYLHKMNLQPELIFVICSMFAISGTPPSQIKAGTIIGSGYSKNLNYPIGGTMQIPLRMLEKIKKQEGSYYNRWPVKSIDIGDDSITIASDYEVEITSDLVISNIGIINTLKKIQNRKTTKSRLDYVSKLTSEAIPLTTFLFNLKEKPIFIGRCPFNVYFPFNTYNELNDYLTKLYNKKNPIGGFYFHFPSLIDRSLSNSGNYPLSVFVPSSLTSSKSWTNKVQEYLIEEIDRYLIFGFKKNYEISKILSIKWYEKRFGGSAAITPISPASELNPINPRISKNLYLTGTGVYKMPPSLVQAVQSGIYVEKCIIDEKLK